MTMNSILRIIRHYYPQNLTYDSKTYINSTEHKDYLAAIKKNNHELYYSLQRLLPDKVEDFTSLEYPSYEYIILLNKSMKADFEVKQELYLYISKLCNCYYYLLETVVHENEEKYTVLDNPNNVRKEIKKLKEFLKQEGYQQITKQQACKIIDNVETELRETPTVFHLLFSDLYDFYF